MRHRHEKFTIARPGVTLIELLVSIVILGIMIGSFSLILSQTQKLVSGSTKAMRANQSASTISQVVNEDISQASAGGFLSITQTSAGGSPRLLMTSAGISHSITSGVRGTGSCIQYGLAGNVLFRQGWILNASGGGSDVWPIDLTDLQSLSRAGINTHVNNICAAAPSPAGSGAAIVIPPTTLAQVDALWQCLPDGCQSISIMWTDGTLTGGNLNWYGINADGTVTPKDGGWVGRDITTVLPDQIEFSEDGGYRALWTQHNKNNWPKAIKIRLTLSSDLDLPAGMRDYEIICALGG